MHGYPKGKMCCATCKYWAGLRKEEATHWNVKETEIGICLGPGINQKKPMKPFSQCTKWVKT